MAILQSGYLPWLGYFDLIDKSDVFVFLDDVQWTRRDWRNRNRIRTADGWMWLTVPVKLEGDYRVSKIFEVKIDYSQNWIKKHLSTIRSFYGHSRYFSEIWPMIEEELCLEHEHIVDLNYGLIKRFSSYMGLKTEFAYAQDLAIPSDKHKTDHLLAIIDKFQNVTHYISGKVARDYLDTDRLKENGISVEWHEYEHPYYNQNRWKTDYFISYLSAIDLLFHHGGQSIDIIRGKVKIPVPERLSIIKPDEVIKPRE